MVNSDYFLLILLSIDKNIYEDYIKTSGKYEETVKVIDKINGIFHNKMMEK